MGIFSCLIPNPFWPAPHAAVFVRVMSGRFYWAPRCSLRAWKLNQKLRHCIWRESWNQRIGWNVLVDLFDRFFVVCDCSETQISRFHVKHIFFKTVLKRFAIWCWRLDFFGVSHRNDNLQSRKVVSPSSWKNHTMMGLPDASNEISAFLTFWG